MELNSAAATIVAGLKDGSVVPYLGPGVLSDVNALDDNSPIPADSDSLILAMNDGRPMAPRLMYEFPRAAMNLELKKGRSFIERFLTQTYGQRQWSRSALHQWLGSFAPPYVIDINRDTQLQDSYRDRHHLLILGTARLGGSDYRFKLYQYDGSDYRQVEQGEADFTLPILFKPMGSPKPEPSYVASDADYVDYITELMGGFALPDALKFYRRQKQYLILGVSMGRDTERMVLSDMIYDAKADSGWALIPEPSDKERRFCRNKKIALIEADWPELLQWAAGNSDTEVA